MHRKHPPEALLRPAQPPRRRARALRHGPPPTPRSRNRETAEINAALLLETAPRAARADTHLLSTNTGAANGRATPAVRRLRHASAERERQHGRGHGYRYGRRC
jgi:hypothetical protein